MTKQERIDFILRQVMNIDGQRVALNETKEYIERQLRELNPAYIWGVSESVLVAWVRCLRDRLRAVPFFLPLHDVKERTLYSEQLQIINEKDLVPNGPV